MSFMPAGRREVHHLVPMRTKHRIKNYYKKIYKKFPAFVGQLGINVKKYWTNEPYDNTIRPMDELFKQYVGI